MFDKTFLLLIIFSVAWSTWHLDDKVHAHKDQVDEITGEVDRIVRDADGKAHAHIVGYTTNPLRIYIPSTLGAIFINFKSILHQDNIWVNEVRLFVAIVLILVLVNYMYSICKQHLENLSNLTKHIAADLKDEDVRER